MIYKDSAALPAALFNEVQLLEMIYAGAPLPQVLDRVCTALDVQVGNVMTVVLLRDDEEHTLHTIAENAAEFGLHAFSCTAILSPTTEFLGTLELYCCFRRTPNLDEEKLIQRAAHLAALAIQQHYRRMDREYFSLDGNGVGRRSFRQGPPSNS
jgi:hypothetical protein